jgi:disulfide bond formation protein DsbB
MNTIFQKYAWLGAWVVSVVGMLGSLFFSLVMKLPPCDLCWYQRITLYPIVVILGVGMIRKDKTSIFYAYPLAVIGFVIAAYHNLLYYNILPEAAAPCISGISCTTRLIQWFGFLTIPLLSFISFSIVIVCLETVRRSLAKQS